MALLEHRDHEDRPWGSFDRFTLNEASTVKILRIKPDQELSLQTHAHRSEFWRILDGSGTVTVAEAVREAKVGDEFEIPMGVPHRIASGANGLTFLEIAEGTFDENDEMRLADDYGRAAS